MRKKSCQKDWPRVPERFGGIQVNGCGAPDCENFGLSPVHEERICKESNRETDDRQILEMPEPFRIQGTGLNSAAQTPRKDHLSRQIREDQRIEKGQWINPSTLFVARPCQTRSTLSERLGKIRGFSFISFPEGELRSCQPGPETEPEFLRLLSTWPGKLRQDGCERTGRL